MYNMKRGRGVKIMGKKIARLGLALTGALILYSLTSALLPLVQTLMRREFADLTQLGIHVMGALLGALIVFLLSPRLIALGIRVADIAENYVQRIPVQEIVIGTAGLILGLIIATLLTGLLVIVPFVGAYLRVIAYLVLGYLGLRVAVKKSDELSLLLLPGRNNSKTASVNGGGQKVLDTSVIIDGRILDISRTGFLEGKLIVPSFVLEELRHIADSADALRRNRGRRGLDVLNNIQKESSMVVEICNKDFDDLAEVDSKLVRLAQQLGAKILTNDYNLNKVSEVQGVSVLNINELANALKPMVLPGEEMSIQIMREGKEHNQGVAYLDDGTMIVVEQGKRYIGDTVAVIVTSVLQTAAGRMIFARIR